MGALVGRWDKGAAFVIGEGGGIDVSLGGILHVRRNASYGVGDNEGGFLVGVGDRQSFWGSCQLTSSTEICGDSHRIAPLTRRDWRLGGFSYCGNTGSEHHGVLPYGKRTVVVRVYAGYAGSDSLRERKAIVVNPVSRERSVRVNLDERTLKTLRKLQGRLDPTKTNDLRSFLATSVFGPSGECIQEIYEEER